MYSHGAEPERQCGTGQANISCRMDLLEGTIVVTAGDITKQQADIIVNAANSTLLGGGGVDGAIHRAGGPSILRECRKIRETRYPDGLPTGKAVATTAGDLPAAWVVHTPGPVWKGGGKNEETLLADCYSNSMSLAFELGASSIAFPAISTGIYRFPRDRAARIAFGTVKKAVEARNDITVIFVFFSEDDMNVFIDSIADE